MNILKAIVYATYKHRNQKRKISNLPYVTHPIRAGYILYRCGFENDLIVATILHDVLEDCDTTPEQMERHFGKRVTELVKAVSDNHGAKSIGELSREALVIKIADTMTNVQDYIRYGGGVSKQKFERYCENLKVAEERLSKL